MWATLNALKPARSKVLCQSSKAYESAHKPVYSPVYDPGYLHMDVKYLLQMTGENKRRYLLVAIDKAN